MKLLVTGGAGYIGAHVAHRLVELGHQVTILDNLYSGHRWAVPNSAVFVEGDVGDQQLLKRLLAETAFDGVLHFAAHIEVAESVSHPEKYFRNNTLASLNLIEATRRAGVRNFIFSSTAAVYGEPRSSQPLDEEALLAPASPYGASKLMTERMLRDVAASTGASSGDRMKFVILRYFNAAGAKRDLSLGQATPRATHLIKIASEVAVGARESMMVFGADYPTFDGTCLRDYIHVEDLAEAHVDALKYLDAGGESDVFNVGYGKASSVLQVIETVKKVSGRALNFSMAPRRPGDPSILFANSEKIQRALGWKPRFNDLEQICRTAYEWELKLQSKLKEGRSSQVGAASTVDGKN